MVNLFENLGNSPVTYLEAGGGEAIAVSMEPGSGTVKRGTVIYRKSSGLYAAAASGNIATDNNLAVLREDVDIGASATIAPAASAYISGKLLAKYVVLSDGETNLSAAQALILRKQGIVLYPFDDLTKADTEFDNMVDVDITVTNDTHGTGSASPSSGTKGTEVTLTATPADNYEFDAWEVVSGDVTIVNNKFTIGDKAVTVKATFKAST